MAISAVLRRERSDDDRSADRYGVRFDAVRRDLEDQKITVHDVSALGILVETHEHLSEGSSIRVELPGVGDKDATIDWGSGSFHGAQFSEALSAAELQQITAASPVVWATFRDEDLPRRSDRASAERSADDSEHQAKVEADEERLPIATRARIIVGISVVLWAGIASGVWLALS